MSIDFDLAFNTWIVRERLEVASDDPATSGRKWPICGTNCQALNLPRKANPGHLKSFPNYPCIKGQIKVNRQFFNFGLACLKDVSSEPAHKPAHDGAASHFRWGCKRYSGTFFLVAGLRPGRARNGHSWQESGQRWQ